MVMDQVNTVFLKIFRFYLVFSCLVVCSCCFPPDATVVNCIQCHPFDFVVATSGIDSTIKVRMITI